MKYSFVFSQYTFFFFYIFTQDVLPISFCVPTSKEIDSSDDFFFFFPDLLIYHLHLIDVPFLEQR